MADTWQALNSLSRTMRDRGGISDATMRGLDATIGLKKMEYDIGQSEKREAREQEVYEAGAPKRLLEKQQFEDLTKPVPLRLKGYFPSDSASSLVQTFAKTNIDNLSTYDIIDTGLPGKWISHPETGEMVRGDKDNKPILVPQWRANQYEANVMLVHLANTDPVYFLGDQINENKMKLEKLDPKSPEYAETVAKIGKMEGVLGNKNEMAKLYGNQSVSILQALNKAIQGGVNSKFIDVIEGRLARAEAKFDSYNSQVTEKERLENNVLKQRLKTLEAQAGKFDAERKKAERPAGEKGTMTDSQRATHLLKIEDVVNEYRLNQPVGTPIKEVEKGANELRGRLIEATGLEKSTEGLGAPKTKEIKGDPSQKAQATWDYINANGIDAQATYKDIQRDYPEAAPYFLKLMQSGGKKTLPGMAPGKQTPKGVINKPQQLKGASEESVADYIKTQKKEREQETTKQKAETEQLRELGLVDPGTIDTTNLKPVVKRIVEAWKKDQLRVEKLEREKAEREEKERKARRRALGLE